MKFNELSLSKELIRAIDDCGYQDATYIQSACIPVVLSGGDIIGQSQTGTGKTAAFAIPIIEQLQRRDNKKKPQALILSPTRELAIQVAEEIRKFAKYKEGIRTVCIYGGSPIQKQIQELKKGVDIVVGCPGRILDHINRKTLRFDECHKLVLDEADEMLNMGFREDIEKIMTYLPEERQTVLFSATMPKAILEITGKYQKNPIHIKNPEKQMTAKRITQVVYECNQGDKKELLIQLVELMRPELAMIFCNTKRMVDDLTSDLVSRGYPAAAIHGDMKQEARAAVMESFKAHRINILVCTDVAARGIDIANMDVVYNFDYPQESEYYVHRIGRTGRAGKDGLAITLLTPRQKNIIHDLKRMTGAEIEKRELPNASDIEAIRLDQINNDIQKMLDKKVDNKIIDIIKGFNIQGYSDTDIAYALAHHLFASSLLKEIKKPKQKTQIKAKMKDTCHLRINIGKKQEVAPAHIVSAIAEATGIAGQEIGKIRIGESETLVEVPKEFRDLVMKEMKDATIKDYSVTVSEVKDDNKSKKRRDGEKDYRNLDKKKDDRKSKRKDSGRRHSDSKSDNRRQDKKRSDSRSKNRNGNRSSNNKDHRRKK